MPADAEYTIEMDGKVVAEYCQKCRRFTKGDKKHSTKEHKKKKANSYMAQSRPAPAATESVPTPPSVVSFSPPVDYSFDAPLQRSGGYFSAASIPQSQLPLDDDDDSCGKVDPDLLAVLNSFFPKG